MFVSRVQLSVDTVQRLDRLLPFIPEGVAIIPPISNGLSDLITTDDPVEQIMATMKAGEDDIMKKAGYPKPFPTP